MDGLDEVLGVLLVPEIFGAGPDEIFEADCGGHLNSNVLIVVDDLFEDGHHGRHALVNLHLLVRGVLNRDVCDLEDSDNELGIDWLQLLLLLSLHNVGVGVEALLDERRNHGDGVLVAAQHHFAERVRVPAQNL